MMDKPYRILIVEDDKLIRRALCLALEQKNYIVLAAADGKEFHECFFQEDFNLVLLDVLLPDTDGWTLLKEIRCENPALPVIMITAKGAENDRVRGLQTGADDYIVKPFSILELLARMEAVLRRCPGRPRHEPEIPLSYGILDLKNWHVVFPDGRKEALTVKEYGLIHHLATHPGRVISKGEILSLVWKMDPRIIDTRSVDVTLNRLRDKLGPMNKDVIRTYRGRGYAWHRDS